MRDFVTGLDLARGFYVDVVAGLLDGITHSAARLGEGSDVLGFDTERSTDHGWGSQLQLFVAPGDTDAVKARLERDLPDTYAGWPVRFGWDEIPVSHHVDVDTVTGWLDRRVGLESLADVGPIDW